MNGTVSTAEHDEFVSVGRPLPRIAFAEPLDRRHVGVVWRGTDRSVVVDISPALVSLRIFSRLRTDDALFAQMKVTEDANALEWPDGAELSAVWLEELADATLSNAEFRDAMERMNLTLDGMALSLGIARRLIADYRKDKPIPKTVALATRYLLNQRTSGS